MKEVQVDDVAGVVEPHGRQIRATSAAHNRNDGCHGLVDEGLVDRIKIIKARHRIVVSHSELPILRA